MYLFWNLAHVFLKYLGHTTHENVWDGSVLGPGLTLGTFPLRDSETPKENTDSGLLRGGCEGDNVREGNARTHRYKAEEEEEKQNVWEECLWSYLQTDQRNSHGSSWDHLQPLLSIGLKHTHTHTLTPTIPPLMSVSGPEYGVLSVHSHDCPHQYIHMHPCTLKREKLGIFLPPPLVYVFWAYLMALSVYFCVFLWAPSSSYILLQEALSAIREATLVALCAFGKSRSALGCTEAVSPLSSSLCGLKRRRGKKSRQETFCVLFRLQTRSHNMETKT